MSVLKAIGHALTLPIGVVDYALTLGGLTSETGNTLLGSTARQIRDEVDKSFPKEEKGERNPNYDPHFDERDF